MRYIVKTRHLYTFITSLLMLVLMSASSYQAAPDVGDAAPDFTLHDEKGNALRFENLKGRVTLIDFWASWCQPCRAANKELKELYAKYGMQGFEIISISIDKNKDAWVKALRQDNLPWKGSVLDKDLKVSEAYGVEHLPFTYLVDEHGDVVDKNFDPLSLEPILHWYFVEQAYFYPCETADRITFTSKMKYDIQNASGKTVLKGKDQVADISGLQPGTYTVFYDGKKEPLKKSNNPPGSIEFYPTRVDKVLNLSSMAFYEIHASSGDFVMKGKGTAIDVSKFPSNTTYMLSINGKEAGKFIKK